MNWVCIDGKLVPSAEAKISVWDHGYLYGDGLFETMRAYNGKIFALAEHLKRLRQGAEYLRLALDYTDQELGRLLYETIKHNNLSEAYIRLTYSRGEGPIGLDPALCPKGTLVIMAKASQVPAEVYSLGVSLGVSPIVRNHPKALPPAIKSMNFVNNVLAKIWAKEQGYDEALLLSQEGWLSETTVSNLFLVRDGKVFTPALEVGILPGVTRDYAIKAIQRLGLPLEEGFYNGKDLLAAEEVFLTNSGSEVIPVRAIDNRPVGEGLPGKLTKQIHASLQKLVSQQLNQAR